MLCPVGSQVWQVRGVTKRSASNPMGNCRCIQVINGNCMVSRMVLCGCLIAKKSMMVVEQPLTSVMDGHKRFHLLNMREVRTWMGLFGAPTAKPSRLFSPDLRVILPLRRRMDAGTRRRFAAEAPATTWSYWKDGRLKTQSCRKAMKETQVYTDEYGAAAVDSFLGWRKHAMASGDSECSSESDYEHVKTPRSWPEAMLTPIIRSLGKIYPDSPGHF